MPFLPSTNNVWTLSNSAKLPHPLDWTWSTACSWCPLLCNLLGNPWACEFLLSRKTWFFKYIWITPIECEAAFPADQETNSCPLGWWSWGISCPWGKLFCWLCCRNPCSSCYVSIWCRKDQKADRGESVKPALINMNKKISEGKMNKTEVYCWQTVSVIIAWELPISRWVLKF